jgi:hypothetical protein
MALEKGLVASVPNSATEKKWPYILWLPQAQDTKIVFLKHVVRMVLEIASKITSRPFFKDGRRLAPFPLPAFFGTPRRGNLFALGRSDKAFGVWAVCSSAPNYMESKCAEPSKNRRLIEELTATQPGRKKSQQNN